MVQSRPLTLLVHWSLQLALPAAILYWLFSREFHFMPDYAFSFLAAFLVLLLLYYTADWEHTFRWLSYLYLGFFFLAAVLRYPGGPLLAAITPAFLAGRAFHLVVAALSGYLLHRARRAAALPAEALGLSFPLRDGVYLVAQGGDGKLSPLVNLQYQDARRRGAGGAAAEAARFALDIIKLGRWERPCRGILPPDPASYHIYGEPVYSPAAGVIREAVDGMEDSRPYSGGCGGGPGNRVVIRAEGYDLLLGHLQKGSIAVRPGETIAEGQLLGRVGNSGCSSRPHLHLQAGAAADGDKPGRGMPVIFQRVYPVKNRFFRYRSDDPCGSWRVK